MIQKKLQTHEVLIGLLGVYKEKNKTDHVAERSKLYKAIYGLCCSRKDGIFDMAFTKSPGEIVSSEVDLGLRNLSEYRMLKRDHCSGYYRVTDILIQEYEKAVKPKLINLELFIHFESACDNHLK
jgi:hypothetical protein